MNNSNSNKVRSSCGDCVTISNNTWLLWMVFIKRGRKCLLIKKCPVAFIFYARRIYYILHFNLITKIENIFGRLVHVLHSTLQLTNHSAQLIKKYGLRYILWLTLPKTKLNYEMGSENEKICYTSVLKRKKQL